MVSRPFYAQNPSENLNLKEPAYAPDEDPKQHRAGSFRATPLLNSAERKRHFDFPVAILQIAAELRTAANQLCFLLSCGYFRATHRFYPVQTFRPRNISHVAERTGINDRCGQAC